MDQDDFDNFEFIDYTTSGPWERFIVQIEDCLKQWGLVHNSYGVFNPQVMPLTTEGTLDLDQELALALNDEDRHSHQYGSSNTGSIMLPQVQPQPLLPPPTVSAAVHAESTQSKVYQHIATVTLENTSYILSYRYHPAKARIAAGVERIDLDFLPTTLEGLDHHILHRWTALTHILVLAPVTNADSLIIDLGSAKLLLSSFAIAFQNTGCNIPVFVPTGQPRNRTYTGLSIQPLQQQQQQGQHQGPPGHQRLQQSRPRDYSELEFEETAEDQAIEVRFNTVLVPYPPAQYTNLSGILDLFIERMGIEDEYSSNGSKIGGVEDGPEGYSQQVKEQIYVSGLFSYKLDNWYDDEWQQWASAADNNGDTQSAANAKAEATMEVVPKLPFGQVKDPLKTLQLVARFASAPSTVYLDSKNLTGMDASQANIWIMNALFKSDDYGQLSGILEDAMSSWSAELASSRAGAGSNDHASEKDQPRSYASLLRKGARFIQGTIAMVDAVDVEGIAQALCSKPAASLPSHLSNSTESKRKHTRRESEPAVERVISAMELGLHFRHATTVPHNSFLWKMLQHLVDVISPDSHISYPTSFMGFLKAVWTELLGRFAEHWRRREMIPYVHIFAEEGITGDESILCRRGEGEGEGAEKEEAKVPAVDLRFNLLHQKLSIINCCIARDLVERNRQEEATTQEACVPADDSTSFFSAASSPASSSKSTGMVCDAATPTAPKPTMESSVEDVPGAPGITGALEDGIEVETQIAVEANCEDRPSDVLTDDERQSYESLDEATAKLELEASSDASARAKVTPTLLRPTTEVKREGATKAFQGLTLLDTGTPLMVPRLQDPGYMTEDMIQQQEDVFECLGSSVDAAKTRAHMQSAQLVSDMSAFKAANPGCILGDFVRWHSPKDWDEDQKQMSARMADSGNLWQELWENSDPLPASRQTPLFNHREEADNALMYLKSLSGAQVFAQLLPTMFLIGYDTLASHPVSSKSPTVARTLQELAQELTDRPWNELVAGEWDLDVKTILAKFREAESVMGRFMALIRKFPEQYGLAERILEDAESVVEDGTERDCVYKLFTVGGSAQSTFPRPTCREFVIETFDPSSASSISMSTSFSGAAPAPGPLFVPPADSNGWHARPLQRRMYACFRESEVRIVEAIAKDGMFM